MERKIIITEDGSATVFILGMNLTYHSVHGAIRESMHVFIEAGYKSLGQYATGTAVNVLEVGFGTGLNALLTLIEAGKYNQPIHYNTIELFPLQTEAINQLNYCQQLNQSSYQPLFDRMHQCYWEKDIAITPSFQLHKTNTDLLTFSSHQSFDLIYFDAFDPAAQPQLWTKEVFDKLYAMLSAAGILVTYSSKGDVRRAMQAAGFTIEKIPGPPHKREMIRATKAGLLH